ncbi:MAG TPA: hypothetical protein V6D47_19235 [Oscillatoriaceae cyanobacterium]
MHRRLPRISFKRRRGSVLVVAFGIVIALVILIAGINTMLQNQISQADESEHIAIAKLQSQYLAEMGLNQVMYAANVNPDAQYSGTNDAFTVPAYGSGKGQTYDFKQDVALVRNMSGGAASCTIQRLAPQPDGPLFQVVATLVTDAGTFHKTIDFGAKKMPGTGEQWVLSSYTVVQ